MMNHPLKRAPELIITYMSSLPLISFFHILNSSDFHINIFILHHRLEIESKYNPQNLSHHKLRYVDMKIDHKYYPIQV